CEQQLAGPQDWTTRGRDAVETTSRAGDWCRRRRIGDSAGTGSYESYLWVCWRAGRGSASRTTGAASWFDFIACEGCDRGGHRLESDRYRRVDRRRNCFDG